MSKQLLNLLVFIVVAITALPAISQQPDSDQIQALTEMGKRYYNGSDLTKKNVEKAREYFEKAAESGNADALYYLGTIYYSGEGVARNEEKGEAFYRKAAAAGNADAQMIVGVMHILEGAKHENDAEKAAGEFTKAAAFMKPAAEAGNPEAQFWYGDMLIKGSGVKKDEAAGMALLKQSALSGNANGLTMLGMYYWLGIGVQKDPVRAYQYILLGQRAGNENAGLIMKRTLSDVTDEQKSKAIAKADAWEVKHGPLAGGKPSVADSFLQLLQ